MFAESLLESGNAHPKGCGWATTLSLVLQSALVALLAAMPMLRPDALPLQLRSASAPIAWGAPEAPPTPEPAGRRPTPNNDSRFFQPREILAGPPRDPGPTPEAAGPPCPGACTQLPPGSRIGVPGAPMIFTSAPPPVKPPTPPALRRVSVIDLGAVVHQVRPVYPPIAQQIRLEGTVVLRALIARDGRVTNVQVLSGHGLFHESAKAAVTQWRYRPYILNGEPVEVETQITVNYRLAR